MCTVESVSSSLHRKKSTRLPSFHLLVITRAQSWVDRSLAVGKSTSATRTLSGSPNLQFHRFLPHRPAYAFVKFQPCNLLVSYNYYWSLLLFRFIFEANIFHWIFIMPVISSRLLSHREETQQTWVSPKSSARSLGTRPVTTQPENDYLFWVRQNENLKKLPEVEKSYECDTVLWWNNKKRREWITKEITQGATVNCQPCETDVLLGTSVSGSEFNIMWYAVSKCHYGRVGKFDTKRSVT